jgi:exosortase/archaeosortase family protein
MAALCLGELLRLSVPRRAILLAAGIASATVWNAGRIFVLGRIAYDEGSAASEAAHDAVGLWVLVLTYGGISLCAWLLTLTRGKRRSIVRLVGRS